MLRESDLSGNLLFRTDDGAVWTTDAPPRSTAQGQPVVFEDTTAALTLDEAHHIAGLLREAITRAVATREHVPGTSSQPYLLMATLLPLNGT